MANNIKDTLQDLIHQVTNDASLPPDKKVKLLESLQKISTPLQSDWWIFRLVVAFLGLAVLLTIIGGFYLSIKTAATIPEGLIALGSAAVGALAGLLAPHQWEDKKIGEKEELSKPQSLDRGVEGLTYFPPGFSFALTIGIIGLSIKAACVNLELLGRSNV